MGQGVTIDAAPLGEAGGEPTPVSPGRADALTTGDVVWAMGGICALNRKPFDAELLVKQFPPPYSTDSLIHAARALGFRIKRSECESEAVARLNLPCLVLIKQDDAPGLRPAIVVKVEDDDQITLFDAGTKTPSTVLASDFAARFAGIAFQLAPVTEGVKDPDSAKAQPAAFGFHWFKPELMKHKRVWRDVFFASLVIQLLALGTPLFTQVVIDKVVVLSFPRNFVCQGKGYNPG